MVRFLIIKHLGIKELYAQKRRSSVYGEKKVATQVQDQNQAFTTDPIARKEVAKDVHSSVNWRRISKNRFLFHPDYIKAITKGQYHIFHT